CGRQGWTGHCPRRSGIRLGKVERVKEQRTPPEADSSLTRRLKIPPVTDLVRHLAPEVGSDPSVQAILFAAAQQVCTEELKRLKGGSDPASLSDLLDRVRGLLPFSELKVHSAEPFQPVAMASSSLRGISPLKEKRGGSVSGSGPASSGDLEAP